MATATQHDHDALITTIKALEDKLTTMIQTIGTIGTRGQQGLNAKDLKPDKFNNKDNVKQTYRQWVDDLTTWLNMVEPRAAKLKNVVAGLTEWNTVTCNARMTEAGVPPEDINTVKDGMLMVLKKFTEGEARTIVDTCDDGAEALFRLNSRYFSKTDCHGRHRNSNQAHEPEAPPHQYQRERGYVGRSPALAHGIGQTERRRKGYLSHH